MQGRNVSRWVTEITGLRLLAWVLLGAWFLWEPLSSPTFTGHAHDWAYFMHHAHSAYLSLAVHHQIPSWDPYFCGGIPALGSLQNNVVAPSFLFPLVFGLMAGLRIGFLAFFVAGMEGTYRLTRHLGVRGAGAFASALVFCFSGRFVQLFHDGHTPFLAFLLTPWALLCLEKGLRSWRWTAAGAAVMTLVFLEGGAVPLPIISVLMLVWSLCRALALLITPESDLPAHRPLVVLAAMAAISLGLSAFRLIPVMDTILHNPRIWQGEDVYTIGHVVNMLMREGEAGYTGDGSAYTGHLSFVLLLFALLMRDRRVIVPLVVGAVLLEMATGSDEIIGLFPALRKFPVLENIRNPFRITVLVSLLVAVGAGCGIDALESVVLGLGRKITQRASRAALVCTALVVSAFLVTVTVKQITDYTHPRLENLFNRPAALTMTQPFRQSLGNRWYAHVWPAANLGSLSCFEEQAFFVSPRLRGDLPREEYLSEPSAGTVTRRSWSPHRIRLDVVLDRPATVIVNQNVHRGWHASTGSITSFDGLLAVELPAGDHDLTLRFRDPLIVLGAVISALTILGLALFELRPLLRRYLSNRK